MQYYILTAFYLLCIFSDISSFENLQFVELQKKITSFTTTNIFIITFGIKKRVQMHTEGYTVFTGPLKHAPKGNQAVKKAEQSGHEVEYFKKSEHCNKKGLDGRKVAQILNDEDNEYKPPTMPQDLRLAIAQARNVKGWNQQQFAKMIQVPKSEVNSWEAGKSVPTGQMIANMDKVLGVKLPRPKKK